MGIFMNRTQIREHIFILLFRADFHEKDELVEQVELYLDGVENASKKDKDEIRSKFFGVIDKKDEIDNTIEQNAKDWAVARIAKAELTVLRLAIYEVAFDDNVPERVAINEAVELAKKYGDDKAPAFINGILGGIARSREEEPQ